MPGIVAVQSKVAYYGISGALNKLPCPFTVPNTARNIGIAWITANTGAGPSGCTDSNGNTWYPFPGYFSNGGYSTLFVCPSLNAGPNTVTVSGLVPPVSPSIAPVLTVLEYAPQGCFPCKIGFQVLQAALAVNGIQGTWYEGSLLTMESMYNASSSPWYSTLIAFINTTPADSSGVARTWTLSGFPSYYIGPIPGVRQSYEDTGTLETGAVADCTIGYPNSLNYITFQPNPIPPPPSPYPGPNTQLYTTVIGLLVSTLS